MPSDSHTEIARIAAQIRHAYDGPSWHGPAVKEVLADITVAQAHQRKGSAHTVLELVLHMAAWKSIVRSRVLGEPAQQIIPEIDWPAIEGEPPAAWDAALARLEKCQTELLGALDGMRDEKLDGKLGNTPWTIYDLLHGVVQHDLYHAGQIALIKKLYS